MKIYFMGICGTAMGNAALLARAAGHEVSGADSGVYPPMSTVLADAGIAVHEGYDPERLARLEPDVVVIGNAMSRGNPEVEWLLETRALRFTSLPAILNEQVLGRRRNLVVAGTHGKTTTTSIAAFLLRENGRDPGFLIGGVPQDPPTGNHLGSPDAPFVIEGDEYDSAFFDKRSKFIHYAPFIAVMNNLEFDHADIFRDLADVQRTFLHLARIVPRNGFIVMNGDDPNLAALGSFPWTHVIRVGFGPTNDVQIVDFREAGAAVGFGLQWRGERWTNVEWTLPGTYNARNAAMAAAAAGLALATERRPSAGVGSPNPLSDSRAELDPRPHINLSVLSRFRGVRRRQEVLFTTPELTVIEDFGHHPTAISETLISFRARFPGAKLTAVFEPRSNTARTQVLQAAFMESLAQADAVYLGAVNRAEKLKDTERFDADAVCRFLQRRGVAGTTAPSNRALLEKLLVDTAARSARPEVITFFSNGSFDGIIGQYVEALKGSPA